MNTKVAAEASAWDACVLLDKALTLHLIAVAGGFSINQYPFHVPDYAQEGGVKPDEKRCIA